MLVIIVETGYVIWKSFESVWVNCERL